MDWFNTTLEKLQAGDIQTAIIVLLALIAIFFISKLLLNSFKAILIIVALVVVVAVLMPESDVIGQAKTLGGDAVEYVKENANFDTLESLKQKASELTGASESE